MKRNHNNSFKSFNKKKVYMRFISTSDYMIPLENDTGEILVFKTNIRLRKDVNKVRAVLDAMPEIIQWNIDRHDVDKVLRIEARLLQAEDVIRLMKDQGYLCEELPD